MRKTIYSTGHEPFRSLLRQVRIEAGLQQIDLAGRLGTSQSVISKIETGDRQIDVLELRQICLAVGISLEDFVRRLECKLRENRADG